MFPSFKNLADKERKRIELLDRAKRRVRQANEKRNLYAETTWASDADNSVSLSKSDQVDQGSQTDTFKKVNNISSSNINPEKMADTPGVRAQSLSSSAKRLLDATIGTDPIEMADAAMATDPIKTVDAETNVNRSTFIDEEEQRAQHRAKRWIQKFYTDNPSWVVLKVHPIRTRTHDPHPKYILGVEGKIIRVATGNVSKPGLETIDWAQTEGVIRNIWYDDQSNTIDELSEMRLEDHNALLPRNADDELSAMRREDKDTPLFNFNRTKPNLSKKRGADEINTTPMKKAIWTKDSSSDTTIDEISAKAKIQYMLKQYAYKLDNVNMILHPILKDETMEPDSLVQLHKGTISVINQETGREKPTILREISWVATLNEFLRNAKDLGVVFEAEPSKSKVINTVSARFKPGTGKEDAGVKSGSNDIFPKEALGDTNAKQVIIDYYKALERDNVEIPFRLHPFMYLPKNVAKNAKNAESGLNIPKLDTFTNKKNYYFGKPLDEHEYTLRNSNMRGHKPVSGYALTTLKNNIQWSRTFDSLVEGLVELQKYNHDFMPDNEDELVLKATIDAQLNIFNNALIKNGLSVREPEPKGKGLKGRGLKGAGRPKTEGLERKGRFFNLDDIQGSSLASAFIYRQIGSKYIRLPNLHMSELYIVHPSRKKIGPKLKLTPELQEMVKSLVYDGTLEQSSYDQLSLDDKTVFKEILKATHIQHQFKNELSDPLESLKAEYDKLKGELMLGNDNPSIIKQLKSICIDMYSNKLIGDAEFKNIITRLI